MSETTQAREEERVPSAAELDAIRAELSRARGPAFWRRLEELAATEPFQAFLRREFPSQAARFGPDVQRRDFLRLMGASLAVAGLGACTRQPDEKILPYARMPESTVPGKPRYFATAMPSEGGALGLLVESHEGRPTKVEGNPDHPASLGSTDAFAQAAILSLYDPDRSHSILRAGQISTWGDFLTALSGRLDGIETQQGEGLRILTQDVLSPTLAAQLEALLEKLPRARWHRWTPLHRDAARRGAELAFGRDLVPVHRLDRARVVLSLDAEFLAAGPGGVRQARDFATARRVRTDESAMLRLYAVEGTVTLTGAMADHRLAVRPTEVELIARAVARELGVEVAAPALEGERAEFARALATDLREHRGAGLVIAGAQQTPAVHALAHAMNTVLGNAGSTVEYVRPPQEGPSGDSALSMRELTEDLRTGRVVDLLILGGNPVYDAPADLEFGEALQAAEFRVHLSLHVDETSRLCQWHLPMAHFLESWSDVRAHDGSVSIVQPLIAPLFGGLTAHDLVAALARESGVKSYDAVRAHWGAGDGDASGFERSWSEALHDGVMRDTAFASLDVSLRDDLGLGGPPVPGELELALRPDASVHDGRHANNGWLQETPRPLTRLVWDNAALVSPRTAERLGVASGDLLALVVGDRELEAPAWVTPGHPDETVTLNLGYGRTHAGGLGSGVGCDAYRLRSTAAAWHREVDARKAGGTARLVSVQDHARMEGRDLVRVATFDRFKADPHQAFGGHADHGFDEKSLYADHAYDGYAWGMVIDLNACIGCNACMVACQSENNVPVVGKSEVDNGRELHWIRIDRYYEGDESDPVALHQPVPCMHCEQAPCEVVCPVAATVHGPEGLNEMVYNRCVGTRYCANNCPYKVRRFNFYHYADYETELPKLGRNPDVTVRSRGVMEKCTYCVQRINHARIDAKKEERSIRDGEAVTACQQACPTQAIAFGDINDENSAISRLRHQPHHYGLLEELGTRPRTTYLAKLTNPNPELEEG